MLVFFFAAMLKRINLKKLDQIAEGSKGASSAATSTSIVKGISIGKKCPQGETPDIAPATKGKLASNVKDKETMSPSMTKKKAIWRFRTPPNKVNNTSSTTMVVREGTSVNPGTMLGPKASILRSPSVAEKILGGVIPPADKEKVDKLSLDQVVTKFFHVIGQVFIQF